MSNLDGWDWAAIDAYHDDEVTGRNGNETETFDFDEWRPSEWDNANAVETLPGRYGDVAVNDSTEPSAVSSPVRFDSPPQHVTAAPPTLPSIQNLTGPTTTYSLANSRPESLHRRAEQATASQQSRLSQRNSTRPPRNPPHGSEAPSQRNSTRPSHSPPHGSYVPSQRRHSRSSHNPPHDSITDSDSETDSDLDSPPNDPTTLTVRMPPSTHPRNGVVDLTDSPVNAGRPSSSRKRRAPDPPAAASASKRKKPAAKSPPKMETSEDEEAPSAEAELLKAQQLSALKAQEENKDAPQKIGQRNCIICLENYTNATVAICGHIFCHECLTRALIASERHTNIGNCPACRKPISRKKKETIIPIALMKKSAYATKGRPKGFIS